MLNSCQNEDVKRAYTLLIPVSTTGIYQDKYLNKMGVEVKKDECKKKNLIGRSEKKNFISFRILTMANSDLISQNHLSYYILHFMHQVINTYLKR